MSGHASLLYMLLSVFMTSYFQLILETCRSLRVTEYPVVSLHYLSRSQIFVIRLSGTCVCRFSNWRKYLNGLLCCFATSDNMLSINAKCHQNLKQWHVQMMLHILNQHKKNNILSNKYSLFDLTVGCIWLFFCQGRK